MKRFRTKRRRNAALALLPGIAVMLISAPGAADAAESARLDANKERVKTGGKVIFAGQIPTNLQLRRQPGQPAAADAKVTIEFRAAGKTAWREVAKSTTTADGSFRQRLRVKRTGRFRAVSPDGTQTAAERIRVRSKLKLRVRGKNANRGEKVSIKGRVLPRGTRRKVKITVAGERITTKTRRNGKFRARWKAEGTGKKRVRAKAKGDRLAAGSRRRSTRLTVYRPAHASWYGPGFYGNRTACGRTLGTGTIGVAHKSLPCGTRLKLRYKGKTVPVKVIDRGPYVAGREFDLTGATKAKLGFGSTGTVYSSK